MNTKIFCKQQLSTRQRFPFIKFSIFPRTGKASTTAHPNEFPRKLALENLSTKHSRDSNGEKFLLCAPAEKVFSCRFSGKIFFYLILKCLEVIVVRWCRLGATSSLTENVAQLIERNFSHEKFFVKRKMA